MDEKAFAFFELCCQLDPEAFKQDDENACVNKIEQSGVEDCGLVEEIHRFFQMKNESREVLTQDVPQLPAEVMNGTRTDADLSIVADHYVQGQKVVRLQILGGLNSTEFEKAECSNCDGFCAIQAAKFLEPMIEHEPPLIVPCITKESKQLETFKILEFQVVCYILIV